MGNKFMSVDIGTVNELLFKCIYGHLYFLNSSVMNDGRSSRMNDD